MERTYAVTWKDAESGGGVGRLAFGTHALYLEGCSFLEVPYDEILEVSVGRGSAERHGGRSSLVVTRSNGRPVWIAPVANGLVLHELLERLSALAGARLSA
jgi:hypothetical protein